jgi:hypothetical protein
MDNSGSVADSFIIAHGNNIAPKFTINRSTFNVGIGVTTPGQKLDVAGTVQCTGFNNTSDSRIKKDIIPADLNTCIDIVNNVQVMKYKYIDPDYKSDIDNDQDVFGYIAQDVEQYLPESVATTTGYIPNVMQNASNLVIINSSMEDSPSANIHFSQPVDLSINDTIKLSSDRGELEGVTVSNLNNDNTVLTIQLNPILNPKEDQVCLPNLVSSANLFVYGKLVQDKKSLDKTKITVVHHGAIQYLHQQNEELKVMLNSALSRISALEANISS